MSRHTRIRPFNTKDTYPEQNLDNDLCQAVVANGVVYLRGQIGQDLETRESVGIGDVETQAEKAMTRTRTETDSLGTLEVPASAYWGIHPLRAQDNFPIRVRKVPAGLFRPPSAPALLLPRLPR